MKGLFNIQLLRGIVLISLFSACNADYADKIERERIARNDEMTLEDSPLPTWEKEHFEGLEFYPIDETYRVVASIERLPVGQFFPLNMTDGSTQQYQKYGYAIFELLGSEHQLLLLRNTRERNNLFLAFTDLTNGKDSYGGGRYLDLEYNNTGRLQIDFNKAYNPYCAFSAQYVCPVPPSENHMDIPIPAGEKTYQSSAGK